VHLFDAFLSQKAYLPMPLTGMSVTVDAVLRTQQSGLDGRLLCAFLGAR
jgi:hypothetical protein